MAAFFSTPRAEGGPSLDAVKVRGELICGVRGDTMGFAHPLADGKYVGLAVDVCRAVSVALLGDETKVKVVPITADKRFPALKTGDVDVLVSGTTVAMTREVELGFEFPGGSARCRRSPARRRR